MMALALHYLLTTDNPLCVVNEIYQGEIDYESL